MSSTNASYGVPGAAGRGQAGDYDPNAESAALSNYLLVTCAAISAALIAWRLSNVVVKYVRTITCLRNDTQRYFAMPSEKTAFFKRYILYSPIFRKRHNREFQLSSAITVGTLPTRLQLLFLVGYVVTNVAFCVIDIPFAASFSVAAAQLRNRTGSLAVVNMVCHLP
jgi:hypothetical protein